MSSAQRRDLVVIARLTVSYEGHRAIADVDLRIPAGTTVAVIGPNGSGKSTLLGAIAGVVEPNSGSVSVDRDRVALVLQSTAVDRTLPITVGETVRMARYALRGMFGRFGSADRRAIREAMERTDVTDLAGRQIHALSGGQRQRVLVAQGLAQEADLLLLDEPVTGLDLVSSKVILDVIEQERAVGRSVVMTTHSLDDAARCDLVVLLAGRVVAAGPPETVLTEEALGEAFGTRVMRLSDGDLLLDDPHHHPVTG